MHTSVRMNKKIILFEFYPANDYEHKLKLQ